MMGWLLDENEIKDAVMKITHTTYLDPPINIGQTINYNIAKAQARKIFERLDKYDKGCPIKDMGRVFDIPLKEWQQFKEEVMG